jgi:hypothetical protein
MMSSAAGKVVRRTVADRTQRLGLRLYLSFVGIYSLSFGFFMARSPGPYLAGDWLINYSGGFVRRGLIGTVLLALNRATHIPLGWTVYAIQAAALLVFLGCVYWLGRGVRWTYVMTAVVLSPATLAFTVVDSYAGIYKDFLLFAALGIVLCALLFCRLRDGQLSVLLGVMLVGLALSHEALMVGVPYFFAAVAIEHGSVRRAFRICALPLMAGGVALLAVILHPGTAAIAQAVCRSVGGTAAVLGTPEGGVCSGSIAWLQMTMGEARSTVAPTIVRFHRVRLYSRLAIPVFTPLLAQIVLLWRRDRLGREVRILLGCMLISLVGTGFLFYVSLDWGRWMHLQAVCLMLMVLMIDHRAPKIVLAKHPRRWVRVACGAAVALYATTWTWPPARAGDGQHGYYDVARLLHHLWQRE